MGCPDCASPSCAQASESGCRLVSTEDVKRINLLAESSSLRAVHVLRYATCHDHVTNDQVFVQCMKTALHG
jgi:hypothetical protein